MVVVGEFKYVPEIDNRISFCITTTRRTTTITAQFAFDSRKIYYT